MFVSDPGALTSWTFDDPPFRARLLRGIAWTAKEPVDRFNDLVWPGADVAGKEARRGPGPAKLCRPRPAKIPSTGRYWEEQRAMPSGSSCRVIASDYCARAKPAVARRAKTPDAPSGCPADRVKQFHRVAATGDTMLSVSRLLETALAVEDLEQPTRFYQSAFSGSDLLVGTTSGCGPREPGSPPLHTPGWPSSAPIPKGIDHDDRSSFRWHYSATQRRRAAALWPSPSPQVNSTPGGNGFELHGVPIEGEMTWPRGSTSLYFRDPDSHLFHRTGDTGLMVHLLTSGSERIMTVQSRYSGGGSTLPATRPASDCSPPQAVGIWPAWLCSPTVASPAGLTTRSRATLTGEPPSRHVTGWVGNDEVDLTVEVDLYGVWRLNGAECPAVAGCLDFDLNFSPSTNLLPVRRLGLAVGGSATVRAAWLRFPSFALEPLDQMYRRTSDDVYRYESGGDRFTADLRVNPTGFVTHYPGGAGEAESMS